MQPPHDFKIPEDEPKRSSSRNSGNELTNIKEEKEDADSDEDFDPDKEDEDDDDDDGEVKEGDEGKEEKKESSGILCPVLTCKMEFATMTRLKHHLRVGKHNQPCPSCKKVFKRVSHTNRSSCTYIRVLCS